MLEMAVELRLGKNALASFRISLALRNSLTSCSNALIRCVSSVVTPGRVPTSTSIRRTHTPSVFVEHPILGAIDASAAVYTCYWISLGVKRRQGSVEDRVLRYHSEVYGSVISIPWVNRLLAGFGMVGCLVATILVNGLCSLYLSSNHLSQYWGRLA